MKLAMPIYNGASTYREVEIKRPTAGVIADTQRTMQDGRWFLAICNFVAGSIVSLTSDTGDVVEAKDKIKMLVRDMKYKAVETLSLDIMLLYDPQDGVEGVYSCPRCGEKIIAEEKEGVDTRDFISNLSRNYYSGEDFFEIAFDREVVLKDKKGNVLDEIVGIGMRYPTIEDYIQAEASIGHKDPVRLQLAVYVKCLVMVNGEPIDQAWRGNYGQMLLEAIDDKRTLDRIAETVNQWGIDRRVTRECGACGKEWQQSINTSNFFASALRPQESA